MKQLPPLKAIRAFEACYRLRSFTRAAQSLNVQQPAISHQIKSLENDLGTKLFFKRGASIEPSKEADSYYEVISAALHNIAHASDKLRNSAQDNSITMAAYPATASFWALPRIESIRKSFPHIKLRVAIYETDADMPLNDVDCAVIYGNGHWPGYKSVKMISESFSPVASPKVAEKFKHLSPRELVETAPLIYLEDTENRWTNWDQWQKKFAPDSTKLNVTMSISNYAVAIYQALAGHGISLGWDGVIQDFLSTGALVKLYEKCDYKTENGHYFIAREDFFETEICQEIVVRLQETAE